MPRKLPAWMSKQTSENKNNGSDYPVLTLPSSCKVVYSHQLQDCALLGQEIRDSRKNSGVLSLDAEWPVSYDSNQPQKIAVLQLCTCLEQVYVFHISKIGCIPHDLKCLLEESELKKIGLNIEGDLWKLHRDFDNISAAVMKNFIDLSTFAQTRLNTSEKWSLARLCRHVLQKDLPKETTVRQSRWDNFPLTQSQIQYAALDVYAGLLIYNELNK